MRLKLSHFGKIPNCSRVVSAEADVNTMTVPDPYSTIVCGASSAGVRQISLKLDEGLVQAEIFVVAEPKQTTPSLPSLRPVGDLVGTRSRSPGSERR